MSIDHIRALEKFISKVIDRPRNIRYITLIKIEKRQIDFIDYLYHDFEKYIKKEVVVGKSKFDSWDLPAFSFNTKRSSEFGEVHASIKVAYYEEEEVDGWLIISQDGSAGIFRPEAPSGEFFIKVK